MPGAGASLFVGKDGAWESAIWRRDSGTLTLQVVERKLVGIRRSFHAEFHSFLQVAPWSKVASREIIVFTFMLRYACRKRPVKSPVCTQDRPADTFLLRNPALPWVGATPKLYVSHGVGSDGVPGGGEMQVW